MPKCLLPGFVGFLLAVLIGLPLTGCATKPELDAPRVTIAPYDRSGGDVLWALAPLRNESATTVVDPLAMSDRVVEAIEQVQGVRCLPMNRTLETMRAIKMPMVRSPADAQRLGDAMGVDAIVVGAITAYDPYDPKIGLALSLIPRTSAMNGMASPSTTTLNSRAVQSSPVEIAPSTPLGEPVSSVSELYDGKNQGVQMDVREYAEGRADKQSAAGWRRYLRSADLFAEFVAYRTVDQLVQSETLRLARLHPNPKQTVPAKPETANQNSSAGH
ncbi:MAG: hypothetical protein U0573_12900 [Phycisphaerales bacterium]|nr:hypothetical protein [Planctomycetota bacterium]